MELKIFAERLTELIFDSKKTARDVAREVGIGKTTIYEYLSGNKMPTLGNLIKIADYFGCSTDYLLGLEEESIETSFYKCKPFSERFRAMLKYFDISRYRLEKMTGIAESVLYYWAKGQKTPTVDSLVTVCEKLNCRLDFFLGRSDEQ
ncbi:MAG: helix-turn-helix domain-containing protein [Christensenellales bacterium]